LSCAYPRYPKTIGAANEIAPGEKRRMPDGLSAERGPIGHPPAGDEMPPWTLAVAESASTGALTGRVGAGPKGRASPEMRPGSHHDDWAATPQAAPQSLRKTLLHGGMVARNYQKSINELVRIQSGGSGGSCPPAAPQNRLPRCPAWPPRTPRRPDSRQTS